MSFFLINSLASYIYGISYKGLIFLLLSFTATPFSVGSVDSLKKKIKKKLTTVKDC